MKCPLVSLIFLKRSLVSHSIVFLYFFPLITYEGFHISPCSSLEFYIQIGISFLFFFAFHFSFSQPFVRPPQTTILPFCISFPWRLFCSLPPLQCYKHLSIVLWALCLSDLIPWICLSRPLYNCRGFDRNHTWMVLCLYAFSLIVNSIGV